MIDWNVAIEPAHYIGPLKANQVQALGPLGR